MEKIRLVLLSGVFSTILVAGQGWCGAQNFTTHSDADSNKDKILGGILNPITDIIDEVTDPVEDIVDEILDPVEEILDPVEDIVDNILDPIGGILDPIGDILDPVEDLLERVAALNQFLDALGLSHLIDQALDLSLLTGDAFEPDNTPYQAAWAGLVLLEDVIGQIAIRNFHVDGDIDWVAFYGAKGQEVSVQTFGLFLGSNTYVKVYRELGMTETLPTEWPAECPREQIPGPGGTTLIPVGCNENADFPLGTLRSSVTFTAPYDGIYYASVEHSPLSRLSSLLFGQKSATKSEGGEGYGLETAYVLQTTYEPTPANSILLNNLFSTLSDANTNNRILDGRVFIKPGNIEVRKNQDGLYPCLGLPDDRYTITAKAANRIDQSLVRNVFGGRNYSEHFALVSNQVGSSNPVVEIPEGWTGHSADFLPPYGRLSLSEVIRIIQLFNSPGFHCSDETDDGYGLGPGPTNCAPHSADYRPQNWKIELVELLRIIQFFNAKKLAPCIGSEDGFCIP